MIDLNFAIEQAAIFSLTNSPDYGKLIADKDRSIFFIRCSDDRTATYKNLSKRHGLKYPGSSRKKFEDVYRKYQLHVGLIKKEIRKKWGVEIVHDLYEPPPRLNGLNYTKWEELNATK